MPCPSVCQKVGVVIYKMFAFLFFSITRLHSLKCVSYDWQATAPACIANSLRYAIVYKFKCKPILWQPKLVFYTRSNQIKSGLPGTRCGVSVRVHVEKKLVGPEVGVIAAVVLLFTEVGSTL